MGSTDRQDRGWCNAGRLTESKAWRCFFCGHNQSSARGYARTIHDDGSGQVKAVIVLCSRCHQPAYFRDAVDAAPIPAGPPGRSVKIPDPNVARIYEEARRCLAVGAPTGAVALCRILLMHVAVENGAKEGLSFAKYVDFLVSDGVVPPKKGKQWVDAIRKFGNWVNHEIPGVDSTDASTLLEFLGFVLSFNYEFPAHAPATPKP